MHRQPAKAGTLQGLLFGKNRVGHRFQSICHELLYGFGVTRLRICAVLAVAQDAVSDGLCFELLLSLYIIHFQ